MNATNTLAVTNSYAQSPPACPDKADFYVRISNPLDVRNTWRLKGHGIKRVRKQERCKRYIACGNILKRVKNRSAKISALYRRCLIIIMS